MLGHMVGEERMASFMRGWFERHALGSAVTTDDFARELGQAAGKDLSDFFATMVRAGGHPELRVTSKAVGADTEITVEQIQDTGPNAGFHFPIDLDLLDAAGKAERVTVDLTSKRTTKKLSTKNPVASIVVDPDEEAVAVSTCGQSGGTCKDRFRCAPQRAGVSVCVPGPEKTTSTRRR
jgi:aminopeptidase N